jgi:hypothetical protein
MDPRFCVRDGAASFYFLQRLKIAIKIKDTAQLDLVAKLIALQQKVVQQLGYAQN